MKKYTVLSQQRVDFEDGKTIWAVIISVDKVEDIPEPLPTWTRGSICLIAKGHLFRMLNGNGVWE